MILKLLKLCFVEEHDNVGRIWKNAISSCYKLIVLIYFEKNQEKSSIKLADLGLITEPYIY
jgi:hypothetical protein